ncbi:glutathione S-transferase family protein [Bosea sp. 2KB_26]|uniref:glutathione S-transferase family protein n=1 Tax=Bosea sp. 2KB_26 TaxID=3237475 RepID=UPI003F8E0D77
MLTVYGRNNSSNVAKVLWTLDELGLPYQLNKRGGSFGGTDDPVYRALNPHGRVPTLDDDGVIVWESNAVIRYLAARYGAGLLWPEAPGERAQSDRWMDWASMTLAPALAPLRKQGLTGDDLKAKRDAAFAQFAVLDHALADRPFIAGEHVSVGDIPLGPIVHRYMLLTGDKPDCANLERYHRQLMQRPAFIRHVADALS